LDEALRTDRLRGLARGLAWRLVEAGGLLDRAEVREEAAALSPAERLCVSLCYGAGVSHVEAAEAMNLPLGTVKSHVKRGLDKLRARLQPQAGQPLGSAQHVG
jgi:RNA polymerase sigma-70 factor (ECF subfamily)